MRIPSSSRSTSLRLRNMDCASKIVFISSATTSSECWAAESSACSSCFLCSVFIFSFNESPLFSVLFSFFFFLFLFSLHPFRFALHSATNFACSAIAFCSQRRHSRIQKRASDSDGARDAELCRESPKNKDVYKARPIRARS